MTIALSDYSTVQKWRVQKTINKKTKQYYFPKTQKGLRAARKKEKELEAERLAACLFGVSLKGCVEQSDKLFKTGVVNVSLDAGRGPAPYFTLTYMPKNGVKLVQMSRSINKHGYEQAWTAVCEKLKKTAKLTAEIPLPPCKKKAKKYLRSVGFKKEYLRF